MDLRIPSKTNQDVMESHKGFAAVAHLTKMLAEKLTFALCTEDDLLSVG